MPQMELEDVLGIKPTQIHQLSTLEQLWRSLDNSLKNEIQKVIFFILMPGIQGFGRRTFCRFTLVRGGKMPPCIYQLMR